MNTLNTLKAPKNNFFFFTEIFEPKFVLPQSLAFWLFPVRDLERNGHDEGLVFNPVVLDVVLDLVDLDLVDLDLEWGCDDLDRDLDHLDRDLNHLVCDLHSPQALPPHSHLNHVGRDLHGPHDLNGANPGANPGANRAGADPGADPGADCNGAEPSATNRVKDTSRLWIYRIINLLFKTMRFRVKHIKQKF